MTTIHSTGTVQVPRYLSPRRLTPSDRIALLRRSPLARDLRTARTKSVAAVRALRPEHGAAFLIGILTAAVMCGLYALNQSYPSLVTR